MSENTQGMTDNPETAKFVYPSAERRETTQRGVNEVVHDTDICVEEQVASNLGEKNLKDNLGPEVIEDTLAKVVEKLQKAKRNKE
ncbi:hypothetical protein LIER_04499 [Lithospermum erythrorhizon]|uniref:Uncharacterized protein n=1 Tax=Lithospermum erythrorhizon TaxID=34254 RepID=A0AAV3P147_LITER